VVVRGSGHGTVTLPVRAEVRIPPSTHDSGFEDTLIHLVELIKAHVEREDAILFPALAALNAEERESLRSEVAHGWRTPARTRTLRDTSSLERPWR
jgi:hypothetical protein